MQIFEEFRLRRETVLNHLLSNIFSCEIFIVVAFLMIKKRLKSWEFIVSMINTGKISWTTVLSVLLKLWELWIWSPELELIFTCILVPTPCVSSLHRVWAMHCFSFCLSSRLLPDLSRIFYARSCLHTKGVFSFFLFLTWIPIDWIQSVKRKEL